MKLCAPTCSMRASPSSRSCRCRCRHVTQRQLRLQLRQLRLHLLQLPAAPSFCLFSLRLQVQ